MKAVQKISALLGPTNTGKTHTAIKRMLGYSSGMIGLPLRLLAREVFDKLIELRGSAVIALVTGEERIIPKTPKYWVCTVEAMPVDLGLEFVAVDEVQLCVDHERGHIFTDRILNTRGTKETMFLGSETMKLVLNNLLPDISIEKVARFSELNYIGKHKIAKIPERSAIVSFSVEDIYAIAELLRRQKGGAAVIMGALSPRTRNAQVALYQNGEVDYLVATDAIGMGMNLNLKHVSFSRLSKFDGQRERILFNTELAQIAGRAGRYKSDGTFGVTGEAHELDPHSVNSIEEAKFPPVQVLQWRNSRLNFTSVDRLIASLEQRPTNDNFVKAKEGVDQKVLKALAGSSNVDTDLRSVTDIKLLWEVCQIPDFRKISESDHSTLVATLFNFLKRDSILPNSWLNEQIRRLNRFDGNIDTLARRLAFIRTWTYVSYKKNWLEDSTQLQLETRRIEDKLSDELHRQLTQRFVDRRTSVLVKGLKQRENLVAEMNQESEIYVDGQLIGRLVGLKFELADYKSTEESRAIRSTAVAVLGVHYKLRSEKIYNSFDEEFSLNESGGILWKNYLVGKLRKGKEILSPEIIPFVDEEAGTEIFAKLKRRLDHFIERKIKTQFEPLVNMKDDHELVGLARGVAFRIVEALGVLPRDEVVSDIKLLEQKDRALLRKHGVRFGQHTIFNPQLLKPAPTKFRLLLFSLVDQVEFLQPPPPGLVTIPTLSTAPSKFYTRAGYKPLGLRAVRVDMLERLSDLLREKNIWKGFEATVEMLSITGLTLEQFADVMRSLGYSCTEGIREKSNDETMENNLSSLAEEKVHSDRSSVILSKDESESEKNTEVYYTFKAIRNLPKKGSSGKNVNEKISIGKSPKNFKRNKTIFGSEKKVTKYKGERRDTGGTRDKRSGYNKWNDPNNPFAALKKLKNKL